MSEVRRELMKNKGLSIDTATWTEVVEFAEFLTKTKLVDYRLNEGELDDYGLWSYFVFDKNSLDERKRGLLVSTMFLLTFSSSTAYVFEWGDEDEENDLDESIDDDSEDEETIQLTIKRIR